MTPESRYRELEAELKAALVKHGTIRAAREATGYPSHLLTRANKELPASDRRRKPAAPTGTSRETMIERLRHVARLCDGRPITRADYDRTARVCGWVTSQSVALAFGTWRGACREAGVDCKGPTGGRSYSRVSADECLRAVVEVARMLGEPPTAQQYERISRALREQTLKPGEVGEFPSMATVRHRIGKWNEITRLVESELVALDYGIDEGPEPDGSRYLGGGLFGPTSR